MYVGGSSCHGEKEFEWGEEDMHVGFEVSGWGLGGGNHGVFAIFREIGQINTYTKDNGS